MDGVEKVQGDSADHFVCNRMVFFLPSGGITVAKNRIALKEQGVRRGFSIVFDELWTDYLPHISGSGALLYCYLKHMAGKEIPNPCSKEWGQEVCQPLSMSVSESHQAWARLQEMGLLTHVEGTYILCEPLPVSAPKQREVVGENAYAQVEALFGRPLSMSEVSQVETLEEAYATRLIVMAAELAVQAQALNTSYIRQVLLNWRAKGITSPEQAEADLEQFRVKKAKRHARKGDRPGKMTEVKAPDGTYDVDEVILRRIKKTFGEEVVGHE